MASVIQTTGSWSDGTDRAMQLQGSVAARLMNFGSNWNSVRVALRWNWNGDSGGSLATPVFITGVCSGTSNPWNNGAATTTNFVGCSSGYTNALRETEMYRWASGNDFKILRRIGTTTATGSALNDNQVQYNRLLTKRHLWFVDITKGSPLYTVRLYYCNQEGASTDVTKAQFLQYSTVATGASTALGSNYLWGTAQTIAVSEDSGSLDSVCVAWDLILPTINIYDFAVVRLA